ncbi:MAG: hypothetical protein ABI808_07545 [Pseudonocardiales bacterium]
MAGYEVIYYGLRQPDGSNTYFGAGGCSNAGRFGIKTGGTWSVRVDGAATDHETGPYRFHIYAVTNKDSTITRGQTVTGAITEFGQYSTYRFGAQTGEAIFLTGDMSTNCTSGYVYYELRKPAGSTTYFGSDGCGQAGRCVITTSGTWSIRVYNSDNGHLVGPYSVTLRSG